MSKDKKIAIVVGGGPAPGINGVIAAATIEALNRGYEVVGIVEGFKQIMEGDLSAVRDLSRTDVYRINIEGGTILRTSRANPTKKPETLSTVVEALTKLKVGYLITIGGDDTASTAQAIARRAEGTIKVAHVPKTIDNDLPLPNKEVTFGFQTAREVATEITETLMTDAMATSRWYLVIAMGRKAGHLALGVGISSGAPLTIIPEEFGDKKITLKDLANIIVGSILKRKASGKSYGVAVLAEGLADVLDHNSLPEIADAERDPHGNIRFAELDFGGILRREIRDRLKELNLSEMLAVDKNIGYELRCHKPNAFDREYTQQLGYGAVDFLLRGGSEAMVIKQGDTLTTIPFSKMIDPVTGRAQVRMVDTDSQLYTVARKYMTRLTEEDLGDSELLGRIAEMTKTDREKIRAMFADVAREYGTI
jgi:6-phosphofructokinase 1